MELRRIPGAAWLALIGGGEFSFGETLGVDRAWLAKAPPGPVGFLPTASGSADYGRHFATYLDDTFERRVETIPVYRERDARRSKNAARVADAAAIYLGGGVADELLEVVTGTPVHEALRERLERPGVVAAVAAAAQALGHAVLPLGGGEVRPGFRWLPGTVIEANFTPAHDRRLRALLESPGAELGLGIPAGSGLLLGPGGECEPVGTVFCVQGAEGDLEPLAGRSEPEPGPGSEPETSPDSEAPDPA